MKSFFPGHRTPERETALIALSLLVSMLYAYYFSVDFGLQAGSSFTIGQATLDGQDVGKRVSFFYRVAGMMFLGWPVLYLLLGRLFSFSGLSRNARSILMVPCVIALLLQLAGMIGMNGAHAIQLMFSISGLTFLMLLAGEKIPAFRFFTRPVFLTSLFLISFILSLSGMAFWNQGKQWNTHFILLYTLITLGTLVLLCVVRVVSRVRFAAIFSTLRHLLWLPLCVWLAIELPFWAKAHGLSGWSFSGTGMVITGIWLLAVLAYAWYRPVRMNATKAATYYLAPGAIAFFVLHTQYHPVLALPGDLFELANPLNAQMNIWRFHRIPCLDFMSSHMLSEQWYGFLYHLLFGYSGNADFLVYRALESFFFHGLVYFFLLKLFRHPLPAFIGVCCFPFLYGLFTENLYPVLLLLLVSYHTLLNQSVRNYVLLIAFLFLSVLWRLDLGVSCILTAVAGLPLIAFTTGTPVNWRQLLKALRNVGVCFLFLIAVSLLLRSPSGLLVNLQNAIHYLGANQAHGYSGIAWEWNQHAVFFYVFLPFLACVFIFYILYLLRYAKNTTEYDRMILQFSVLLFLFMLVNFQRGLVRHGFLEQNDTFLSSTFYLALSLFLLHFVRSRTQMERFLFFVFTAWMQIVVLTYFPLSSGATALEKLTTSSTISVLHDQQTTKPLHRVSYSDEVKSLLAMDSFLNARLQPGQTFFDFSNSPVCYFFTGRPVPSYFCQSLQNTVDPYTQLSQIRMLDTANIPYVLYANSPLNWYDATDGVPNALRYPYLAEFIYRHYTPYAVVANKQVWIANHLKPAKTELAAPVESHDYRKAAGLQSAYYERSGFKGLVFRSESGIVPLTDSTCIATCPVEVARKQHVLLALDFSEPQDGAVSITMRDARNREAVLRFETMSSRQTYMLRVSNFFLWQQGGEMRLLIKGNGVKFLKKIRWFEELPG